MYIYTYIYCIWPIGLAPETSLLRLAKWETITLHVAFQPELVPTSQWHHYLSRCEHVFKGDLVVEYPRETTTSSSTHKAIAKLMPWPRSMYPYPIGSQDQS